MSNADYITELHELLHARSTSYYDRKIYVEWGKLEEGSVELLAEEICKQKQIAFTQSYVEQVKQLRRINRRAKLFVEDIDFAKELINIPVPERMEWLVKKVNTAVWANALTQSEAEGIYDSLSNLFGGF